MTITEIRSFRRGKQMIYLNDEPAFLLYTSEIRRFCLEEGMELSEDLREEIFSEVLLPRARQRALHLLDRQDRTVLQLKEKLRSDLYPEEVIEQVAEAALRGRYLDDRRYAAQYVLEKSRERSRRRIEADLRQKGISPDYVEEAFRELEEGWEEALISRLIRARWPEPESLDQKEKEKLYRYLTGKGFSMGDISKVLRNSE